MSSARTAHVYVIGSNDGPQKVGIAFNPKDRFIQVPKQGIGCEIKYTKECLSRDIAVAVERHAHFLLKDKSKGKEWFGVSIEAAILAVNEAFEAVSLGEAINKPKPRETRIVVLLSDKEANDFDTLMFANRIRSRSEAVRALILEAIEKNRLPPKKEAATDE